MQIPIPTLSKNSIRGLHGIPEATTLLSRVFDYGGLRSTTQRHDKLPRRYGSDCQMGHQGPPVRHNIKPRRAIKSQVLDDFVAEWTEAELPKEYNAYSNWIMHFDDPKMMAGLGAGVVLTSPTGDIVQTYSKYYTQTPTMPQNMRPCCMVSGWQSPWAFDA